MRQLAEYSFPFLKKLDLPPGWEEAAERFLARGGVTLVLGGPDTGKSTLCQYLIYRAFTAGKVTAWVDADLGQSHLGPPTTVGLGLYPPRLPGDQGLFPEGLHFIGQTSPVGALLEVAVATRLLVDQAEAHGVDAVVVNTSGLIRGPAAFRLKQAKVDLLKPSLILALERQGELSPLLHLLGGGDSLVVLPVSSQAAVRSLEERRLYRQRRFRRYFAQARQVSLPLSQVSWVGPPLGWGSLVSREELQQWSTRLKTSLAYGLAGDSHVTLLRARSGEGPVSGEIPPGVHLLPCALLDHALVGLSDAARRTLALGVVLPSSFQEERLVLWTPLPPARIPEVRFVKGGRLKLSLSGQELQHLRAEGVDS